MRKPLLFGLVSCLVGCAGTPAPVGVGAVPALGTAVGSADIARWDISIAPDGRGLPSGAGNARQGQRIYEAKCQTCHGAKGEGKPADRLAGGIGSLAGPSPLRTVGSYWPYATTLFDYVRRAMPIGAPLSLSDDEVYAVCAYVLHLNGLLGEDAILNAQTLPALRMPNRDGFIDDWAARARR